MLVLRQIIAECRSKVLQNAQWEHSAILSIFIKLPFVIKIFVLSILSGFLRQVLLYLQIKKIKLIIYYILCLSVYVYLNVLCVCISLRLNVCCVFTLICSLEF